MNSLVLLSYLLFHLHAFLFLCTQYTQSVKIWHRCQYRYLEIMAFQNFQYSVWVFCLACYLLSLLSCSHASGTKHGRGAISVVRAFVSDAKGKLI